MKPLKPLGVFKKNVADADVKIMSEDAKFWKDVQTVTERDNKAAKNSILLGEEVLKIAKRKLEELGEK